MLPILIHGHWQAAQSTTPIEIRNPATLEVLGTVADCAEGDVDRAVGAARDAVPEWRALAPSERARQIRALAATLDLRLSELASLLTAESGSPACEAGEAVARVVSAYVRAAGTDAGGSVTQSRDASGAGGHVVAVLAPARASLQILSSWIAAALARGDTIVVLAAEGFALATLRLAECFAGLPPGVVNVITGAETTRRLLLVHPAVDAVESAVDAVELAALRGVTQARITNLDLEALAPGPFVICKDADLERAVEVVAWTCLHDAGQSYAACKHLYVDRAVAGDFTTRLHEYVGFLEIDDPAVAAADVGPLRSLAAAKRVEDQVMTALRDRAFPILGGRRFRPSGLPGHFFQPTILSGVPHESATGRAHIHGPVMLVTQVADLTEALSFCTQGNATPAACVLTQDVESAVRALGALPNGTYSVNDPQEGASRTWPDPQNASGVAADLRLTAKPWWFPYAGRAAG